MPKIDRPVSRDTQTFACESAHSMLFVIPFANEKRTGLFHARHSRRAAARPHSTGAVMTPIYATSTYVQESPGKHKGYDYARSINPDPARVRKMHRRFGKRVARVRVCFRPAAMATVLEVLDSGSHLVASDDLYGGTFRFSIACGGARPISISPMSI